MGSVYEAIVSLEIDEWLTRAVAKDWVFLRVEGVTRMIALGLDLEERAFLNAGRYG